MDTMLLKLQHFYFAIYVLQEKVRPNANPGNKSWLTCALAQYVLPPKTKTPTCDDWRFCWPWFFVARCGKPQP